MRRATMPQPLEPDTCVCFGAGSVCHRRVSRLAAVVRTQPEVCGSADPVPHAPSVCAACHVPTYQPGAAATATEPPAAISRVRARCAPVGALFTLGGAVLDCNVCVYPSPQDTRYGQQDASEFCRVLLHQLSVQGMRSSGEGAKLGKQVRPSCVECARVMRPHAVACDLGSPPYFSVMAWPDRLRVRRRAH